MDMENSSFASEYSYIKLGDNIPDIKWIDNKGKQCSGKDLYGKKVLIILFTDNCRYCRNNFAYLEKNLFQKKLESINFLAFGRGCDDICIGAYYKKYPVGISLLADPKNEIYSMFAEKAVPRLYFFNNESKLAFSIRGFRPDMIDQMIHEFLS